MLGNPAVADGDYLADDDGGSACSGREADVEKDHVAFGYCADDLPFWLWRGFDEPGQEIDGGLRSTTGAIGAEFDKVGALRTWRRLLLD
jgi:hypothetical protein